MADFRIPGPRPRQRLCEWNRVRASAAQAQALDQPLVTIRSSPPQVVEQPPTASRLVLATHTRGDVVGEVGTWSSTIQRHGEDARITSSDRYLLVWERGSEGRWRIAYDMWHR